MVIGNPEAVAAATTGGAGAAAAAAAAAAGIGAGMAGAANSAAHPSGIPQDQIDNIMSGIANTGDVKMNNHRKKLRQRFDIIKKLGQGTYGKVQLGINKETGQEVAIKTIKKCKIEAEADLVRIRREVQIMSSVQHPNIIHIYEVFENREKMVLVMEFAAGGELYDYLSERKVLAEEEARRIFRQVATAVYYCHKHKICHRDLKLENILLDEQGNAKIADFGLSNVFDDQRLLATFCGSPLYASPEIVEGTPYQGPEVDCWSLGVLLYTLVYGSMPFDGSNFKRLVKQISQGDYYEPKKPSRASSLIRDMLTVCPRQRATIEQICSHWWVNENDNVSCLDLAEDLANQTPVRLDVLLSLTPTAITAEQMVVPSAGDGGATATGGKSNVPRSHSVGSIRDIVPAANTEAERKILDMVAAGGEAALMPSPTRTITPAQSPIQTKRKLQPTVSTENAVGTTAKKKEKPANSSFVISAATVPPLNEEEMMPMETETASVDEQKTTASNTATTTTIAAAAAATAATKSSSQNTSLAPAFSQKDMEMVGNLCEQLMQDKSQVKAPEANNSGSSSSNNSSSTSSSNGNAVGSTSVQRQKTAGKLDAVAETPEEKDATKVIKKFVNKHKTADLVNAITQATPEQTPMANAKAAGATATASVTAPPTFVRKCSLQDETPLNKFNSERRKSRILETAEKFQQGGAGANAAGTADKPKKFNIPGVSVGSFKKEFERKASTTTPAQGPTAGERRALEQVAAAVAAAQEVESVATPPPSPPPPALPTQGPPTIENSANIECTLEASDSKNSVSSISLDEARRSMENSIALLRQAASESSKEVDQLCAKTESIDVSEPATGTAERERKLKNARAIIGNAIQPVIRRPTPLFGIGVGVGAGSGFARMRANSGSFIGYGVGGGDDDDDAGSEMYNFIERMPQSAPPLPVTRSPPLLLTPSSHLALATAKKTIQDRLFPAGVPIQQLQDQQLQTTTATTWQSVKPTAFSQQQQQQQQQQKYPNQQHEQQQQQHSNSIFYPNMNTFPKPFNASPFKMMQQQLEQKCYETNQQVQQQQQQQKHQQAQLPPFNNNHAKHHFHPYHPHNEITSPPPLSAASATYSAPVPAINNANFLNANANANVRNATMFNKSRRPFYHQHKNLAQDSALPAAMWLKSSPGGDTNAPGAVKTSTASITLKSATLPRRKTTGKSEIQLDIKPRIVEQPAMRFTTEMQHPVADLRSAPPRDGPLPYSPPIKHMLSGRAASLEPKEHIITIQRPPQSAYTRTTSNTTTRSGSLSRQSTVDSESDTATTTTNMSQSTVTGSSQPIKKSPREFIIPIAVEGGGFITPREGSVEPSESSHTTASSRTTFNRLRPTRRIGSLLSEAGIEEGSPFQKMRTASITRDSDDDPRFTLHRLSSRPVKKITTQDNDSQSSGEEDDDDGFEILTAENLFSTLLQRVRALTNRLNVNNDFPNSSRLLSNMRQGQSPFWNQQKPFGRSQVSYTYSETIEKKQVRLNSAGNSSSSGGGLGAPWRHSMSRDLGSDMESMFSRTGATLPRGAKSNKRANAAGTTANGSTTANSNDIANAASSTLGKIATCTMDETLGTDGGSSSGGGGGSGGGGIDSDEPLDLADLDLSRLRLSKQDLETLSSITPGLPKCFQEQLLAKLPPTQARKLSRTLSMQNQPAPVVAKVYKRSQSGGRGYIPEPQSQPLNDEHKPAALLTTDAPTTTAASTAIYRRSLSRTRPDYEPATGIPTPPATEAYAMPATNTALGGNKSRSNSVCRDDYVGKSSALCGNYTSDINDKYKYYSPYLSKVGKETVDAAVAGSGVAGAVSTLKRYSGVGLGRPPSGCLSPPLVDGSSSLRRRSSQRRISRFLRPDFFDEPSNIEQDNPYLREKRLRERETQSVLREIRERSCDRLTVPADSGVVDMRRRKHSLPNVEMGTEADAAAAASASRHVRNKSMEMYTADDEEHLCVASLTKQENSGNNNNNNNHKQKRRSLSRPRELEAGELDKHELADKILQELQLLSAVRSQHDQRVSVPREIHVQAPPADTKSDMKSEEAYSEKTATIKKVKKVKPKEKSTESSTDMDGKVSMAAAAAAAAASAGATPTVVRKVKKLVKKSESVKTPTTEMAPTLGADEVGQSVMKETKLKRPKSYPMKESTLVVKANAEQSGGSVSVLSKLPTNKVASTNAAASNCTNMPEPSASEHATMPRESRLMRPKSYPASKLTAPKDLKKVTRSGAAIPSIAEATVTPTTAAISQALAEKDSSSSSDSRPTTIKKIIKVSKKSKLVPPTPVTPTTPTTATTTTTTTPADSSKESSPATTVKPKEKSPEKKTSKGLLYAIGQKFEKFALSKEKKALLSGSGTTITGTNAAGSKLSSSENSSSPEKIKEKSLLKKKKSNDAVRTLDTSKSAKSLQNETAAEKTNGKSDKRSRIDAMIRTLRERSVPRSSQAQQLSTESTYIKRAVSVEDMPGTFNKHNTVHKVLGLFKRSSDKDTSNDRKVRSTRSTSNIERQFRDATPSPIYENAVAIASAKAVANTKAEAVAANEENCNCETACPDCIQNQGATTKRRDEVKASNDLSNSNHAAGPASVIVNNKESSAHSNKDKRKGLMLDLSKLDRMDNANVSSATNSSIGGGAGVSTYRSGQRNNATLFNGNGLYSNLPPYPGAIKSASNNSSSQQSMDNVTNNNSTITNNNSSSLHTSQTTSGYRTSSAHEINRNNILTPSFENIANYSSDSRSNQDDCASTSTFLSPTDEPELYFDNWSICSEDNYMLHPTPSPTVSRLSRISQLSSPTRCSESSDPNESVIDRIKRRSFYCRFNEKKPKRTSSIVGPSAVRDYYREQQAATAKCRSSNKLNTATSAPDERAHSPDITQQFFRPLKLSPVGSELKPPVYRSTLDYSSAAGKPRKSLNDIRTTTSPSLLTTSSSAARRYGSTHIDNDYVGLMGTSVPMRHKSSSSSSPYESNGAVGGIAGSASSYYSTYNPKRRSSYTLNGTLGNGSSNIGHTGTSHLDGYATVGRRAIRAYDQRTMSLLEPPTSISGGSYHHRRETRTPVRDYSSSISRSNSRYRTSSATRSPTNI